MTNIEIGNVVTCKQTGDQAWVARAKDPNGRWLLISKLVDDRGRATITARTSSEFDLELARARPTFEVGTKITRNGLELTVSADLGDFVELVIPSIRRPLTGGDHLHIPGERTTTLCKSEIVVEALW